MVTDNTSIEYVQPSHATIAPTFLVERSVNDLSNDGLVAIHHALAESCQRLSKRGQMAQYQTTYFAPARGWCLSVFVANDIETVRLANEIAQVPFDRIFAAVSLDDSSS